MGGRKIKCIQPVLKKRLLIMQGRDQEVVLREKKMPVREPGQEPSQALLTLQKSVHDLRGDVRKLEEESMAALRHAHDF